MGQVHSEPRLITQRTTQEDPNMNLGNETLDGSGNATRDEAVLEAKHKVFLSHSGAQKNFVEQLYVDLERCDRYPFFDKRRSSLGIGQHFPEVIFQAIRQCQVGVLILSEEFFTRSKWPMLELAALVDSKKQNSKLVIMPVFLGISREQCRNVKNHKLWESVWLTWKQRDFRIDMEEWKQALSIFGPTNALIYKKVSGEVKFREEIVEAICGCVAPETRWDDSHVQGRSRLCQVVREKVNKTQVSKSFGVRVIGLYGVGGLGKTTICKTLCNNYSEEFKGRVAHVEFESNVEVELMREVLRKLTDTTHVVLAGFNKGECMAHLKAKVQQHNVFLAIDNVCDTKETIKQARVYLGSHFKEGSVVIITACSMEVLKTVGVGVEDCVKMPKLDTSKARSLFLHQVLGVPDKINAQDEVHIMRCLELCQFRETESSLDYLPLALKLLGIQNSTLGFDPNRWIEELPDTSNKVMGSVFDIFKRSFDALYDEDKLLFIDVVLYYPGNCKRHAFARIVEWLSVVHQPKVEWVTLRLQELRRKSLKRKSVGDCGGVHDLPSVEHQLKVEWVKSRLQELKKKSVIEDVGDRVGVHDLWLDFAIMITKVEPPELRRWVSVIDDEQSGFDEVLPSGMRWGALRRMRFYEAQCLSFRIVNLTMLTKLQYCSNVTVLHLHLMKLEDPRNVKVLDLTPLNCLKSLVLAGCVWEIAARGEPDSYALFEVRGLGTLKSLGFLSWTDGYIASASMEDIACLTSLEYLELSCRKCEKLPDLSNLKSLRIVELDIKTDKTCELSGLSSEMTGLKRLNIKFNEFIGFYIQATCTCHGISNLKALEELDIMAVKVEEVFNLQQLTKLQRLSISGCDSIKELRGFADLVALNSFHLRCDPFHRSCNLGKLPHFGKLTNLRILDISSCCSAQSLPGLGELVALEVLEAQHCTNLSELPDLHNLSNLQKLDLQGSALRIVRGLDKLEALCSLSVQHCVELVALPELCKFRDLRKLDIRRCSSLKSLPSLESLKNLRKLKGNWQMALEPHKLPAGLEELTIDGWGSEGLQNSASLESGLDCEDFDQLNSLRTLPSVGRLKLEWCSFRDVSGLIDGTALRTLVICSCHELEDLPDLPHLEKLVIFYSKTNINMGFLPKLKKLILYDLAITELPDLSSFCPKLTKLRVTCCQELRSLTSSAPLSALTSFTVEYCKSLRELPDLRSSVKLEYFVVTNCGIRLKARFFKSWDDVEWEAVPDVEEGSAT